MTNQTGFCKRIAMLLDWELLLLPLQCRHKLEAYPG
jgi:hypothetical protein